MFLHPLQLQDWVALIIAWTPTTAVTIWLTGYCRRRFKEVKLPLWHLGPNGSPTPLPINILPSSEMSDPIDISKNNSETESFEIYRTNEGKGKLTCMICYGTFIPPWMPISRVILQNSKVDLIIPWQQDTDSCEQEDDRWWLRNQSLCWWYWGFWSDLFPEELMALTF